MKNMTASSLQSFVETRPVDFAQLASPIGVKVYETVTSIWDILPKRAVVNGKFFCVHGGIPEHFEEMDNPGSKYFPHIEGELPWNDPFVGDRSQDVEFLPNESRGGTAKRFGGKAIKNFLEWKKLEYPDIEYIVRAHEQKSNPNELENLFTIFSSRYYCNPEPFEANIMNIESTGSFSFESLSDLEINNFSTIFMSLLQKFGPELIEDMRYVKLLPIVGQSQEFRIYQNSIFTLCLDLFGQLHIGFTPEFIESFKGARKYFSMIRNLLNDLEAYENYLDYHGFEEIEEESDPNSSLPDMVPLDPLPDPLEFGSISQLSIKKAELSCSLYQTLPDQVLASISEPLNSSSKSAKDVLGNLNIYNSTNYSPVVMQSPKDQLDPILMKIGIHLPSFRELQGYPSVLLHLLDQFEEKFTDIVDGPELVPEFDELDVLVKFLKKLSETILQ